METNAKEVLAQLEQLALESLHRETERLRFAVETAEPAELAGLDRERGAALDALELFVRAHEARVQLEEEEETGGADRG